MANPVPRPDRSWYAYADFDPPIDSEVNTYDGRKFRKLCFHQLFKANGQEFNFFYNCRKNKLYENIVWWKPSHEKPISRGN